MDNVYIGLLVLFIVAVAAIAYMNWNGIGFYGPVATMKPSCPCAGKGR